MPVPSVGSTRHQFRSTPRSRSWSSTKRPAPSSPTTPTWATRSPSRAAPLETIPPDPPSASVPESASRSAWPKAGSIAGPATIASGLSSPITTRSKLFAVTVAPPPRPGRTRSTWASSRSTPALPPVPSEAGRACLPRRPRPGRPSRGGRARVRHRRRASRQGIATANRVDHPVAGSIEVEHAGVAREHRASSSEAEPHGTRTALTEALGEPGEQQRAVRRGRERRLRSAAPRAPSGSVSRGRGSQGGPARAPPGWSCQGL